MAFLGLSGTWGAVIGIVAIICAVWVIYDVWTKNKRLSDTAKIVWTVFAILLSILTAIVYWLVGRK
ncbi:MAG: PLDc N-terminal domain-containing protein [Candidatus Pacearchaeota archaeon]|nr:PLDc N-terminal domain-containing protein [Candidatus Pacearchaeota archaeon]